MFILTKVPNPKMSEKVKSGKLIVWNLSCILLLSNGLKSLNSKQLMKYPELSYGKHWATLEQVSYGRFAPYYVLYTYVMCMFFLRRCRFWVFARTYFAQKTSRLMYLCVLWHSCVKSRLFKTLLSYDHLKYKNKILLLWCFVLIKNFFLKFQFFTTNLICNRSGKSNPIQFSF